MEGAFAAYPSTGAVGGGAALSYTIRWAVAAIVLGIAMILLSATLVEAGEQRTINMAGVSRTYYVASASSVNTGERPMVIMLHGAGGTGQQAVRQYGWERKAEKEGFIVAGPDAWRPFPEWPANLLTNPRFWNDGGGDQPFSTTPTVVGVGTKDERVLGFDVVTTRAATAEGAGGRGREIVIVTKTSVVRAALTPDKSAFEVTKMTEIFGGNDFRNGSGIAAGDFDGDGVEDLAVAESGAIRIARQRAKGTR